MCRVTQKASLLLCNVVMGLLIWDTRSEKRDEFLGNKDEGR